MASDKAWSNRGGGSSNEWDVDKLRELGFKKGSILRVHMKNFLTYDYSMVFPGPRLNVILGPNGTGKSTITHAICLACAGSANTVGRSPDLKQFVKHNKEGEECFVEVDIFQQPESGKILRIKRFLNTETTGSKWTVDDKKSTEVQVKQLVRELKIDVDNLCSFMPQDKVGNFSHQTPQGILQKTLESVSSYDCPDKNLFEIQKELADIQGSKNRFQADLESKQKTLQTIRNSLQEMETDVRRMEERGENQQLLEHLQVKLCVVESTEHAAKVKEAQDAINRVDAELAEKEASIAPIEIFDREVKIRMSHREKVIENIYTKLNKTDKKIQQSKKEMDELEVQIEDHSSQLKTIVSTRKSNEKTKTEIQQNVALEQKKLDEVKSKIPAINASLEELKPKIQEKEETITQLQDSTEDWKDQLRRFDGEIAQLSAELRNVTDPRAIFKKNLINLDAGRHQNDTKIMDLVEQEKLRGGFRKEVYGPVGAYLKFSDPVVAAMAEKAIPRGKLIGYVAQTAEDEAKLRNISDKINIYTMLNIANPERPYSRQVLDSMREIGLQGYLTDQIECPDAVKGFLHDICNLNHHLWARTDSHAKITKRHFETLCPAEGPQIPLSMFVHATGGGRGVGASLELHSGQRSKYARDNLSLKTETPFINPRLLHADGGSSTDALTGRAECEEKIQALNEKKNGVLSKLKKVNADIAKARDEVNVFQTTRKKLLETRKAPDVHESRLKGLSSKLREVEKKLAKDPVQEMSEITEEQMGCLLRRFESADGLSMIASERSNLEIQLGVEDEALRILREKHNGADDALSEARASLTDLKERKKQAVKRKTDAQRRIDESTIQLKGFVAKFGGNGPFRVHYKDVVCVKVTQETPDEIQARIGHVQVQLENIQEDPEVVRLYKKLQKEEKEKAETVKTMEEESTRMDDNLKARSKHWEEQIDGISEKINSQFSKYMSDLSYSGEVELIKKGVFDKWEMQMRVCFRDNETLTELSAFRHSGGERAVSTIMYLMALQEMTHAPFRAVDEINQGMDERNERLVFDRIVQSCCSERSKPQYFLVSPKLLQGLRAMEHDDITVLMIFNGPGVTYNFSFGELVASIVGDDTTNTKKPEKRKIVRDDDDDDDRSKVSKR